MNTSHNKILLKHLTFTKSFIYIKIYAHEAVHVHVCIHETRGSTQIYKIHERHTSTPKKGMFA